MNRTFRELAETVITAAIIFVVLQAATQTFQVVGPSMDPTLASGQHLVVNKFVYASVESDFLANLFPWVEDSPSNEGQQLFRSPHQGDIIVFRPPGEEATDFVKRVIGLPGDTIDIRGGKVYVNGNPIDEDRVTTAKGRMQYPVTVPPGEYFVLGDNRGASNDSRSWGFVPAHNIVGRVMGRYWPLSAFKLF